MNDDQRSKAYLARGEATFSHDDYTSAMIDFDEAIRTDEKNDEAYYGRAWALYQLAWSGELARGFEMSIGDYNRAIALNPKSAAALYGRAESNIAVGQYRRAIKDLDETLQLWPDHSAAVERRGFTYARLREYERALEDYDLNIQRKSNAVRDWSGYGEKIKLRSSFRKRGSIHSAFGHFEQAVRDYDMGISLVPFPDRSIILRYIAAARLDKGEASSVLKEHRWKLKERDSNVIYADLFLGELIPKEVLSKVLAIEDQHLPQGMCEAYYFIASYHLLNDELHEAARYFQMSIETHAYMMKVHLLAESELDHLIGR